MANALDMPPRPLWMRCLLISTRSFRPSPRVERYLALVCGLIILAVACRVWIGLQHITTEIGIWSGPDDPYLLQFRSGTAWLWQRDPYGVTLMVWGLIGVVVLGPFAPATWKARSWLTIDWGLVTLAVSCIYVFVGFNLMLMPIGRFG